MFLPTFCVPSLLIAAPFITFHYCKITTLHFLELPHYFAWCIFVFGATKLIGEVLLL
jgi:hypothetical protein